MLFQRTESPALLNGHEAARRFFASYFQSGDSGKERLWVAHVDEAARCLHIASYEGEPDSVDIPVKRIMVDAVRLGSAGVVLAHNHPSGNTQPSSADCRATRRLVHAAEPLDVAILDHLVFAGRECSSMRRMGLI